MIIYIILATIFLIIFCLRDTSLYSNVISRDYICIFSFLLLFLLYIFRNASVGTDYPMYHLLFYLSPEKLKTGYFVEKGYIYLNQLAQRFNLFLVIPIISFIVIYFGLYFLIKEFDINKFTFLFFYVVTYIYLFSFDVLRQFIALGIVCIGLGIFLHFHKRVFIKYTLFILIVLFSKYFHSSSIFCLIFLLLPHIKINPKIITICAIFTSVFYFNDFVSNLLNKLLVYFPKYFQKYGSMGNYVFSKNPVTFIPVIVQFIYLFIFVRNNSQFKLNYKYNLIVSGYLLYLILFVTTKSVILQRLQVYTYIFPLIFTCKLFDNYEINRMKLNISSLYKYSFVAFWIGTYILRLLIGISGVVPYSFI